MTVSYYYGSSDKEHKKVEPDYSRSTWTTILSDGTKTKSLPGLFLSSSHALHKLEIKNETKKIVGANGYFITYDIDRLFLRKLGESASHCVLGDEAMADARKSAANHLQECKSRRPRFMAAKDRAQLAKYFKILPECVYHGIIGIQAYKATDFPVLSCFRETNIGSYRIKDGALLLLDEKALPKECLDSLQKQFDALSKSDRESYGFRPDKFAQYLIIPSPAGAKVDVFLTYNLSRFSKCQVLHAGETTGVAPGVEAARSDFRYRNGQLLPKDKLTFASVSPDASALIYAARGKLFWLPANGRAQELANIDEVRGIQWLDKEMLTPAVLGELSLR